MKLQNVQIKETESIDLNDIMTVEEKAFGHDKEAKLTAALLSDKSAEPTVSLLAYHESKAIGHILFTRVYINEKSDQPLIHILAPLAVVPEYQKQGIGGLLIREGLTRLKALGIQMVFVLGHMDYYPLHGFIPDAEKLGYPAPYPIPKEFADAWMAQTLVPGEFTIPKGKVICANALDEPEHWRE